MCSRDREGTANGSVTLSRVSILVGFICALSYFGAFVGTGWVYTKEPYRLTNLNLYTSVTFKIGLWRACHSFKRINSTITLPMPSCTMISYTNWSQLAIHPVALRSDMESTISVLSRIRWCAVFVGSGFVLILVGFVCSVAGHFYKDNKTLLASAMYTLSEIFLLFFGLLTFILLTLGISGTTFDRKLADERLERELKGIHPQKQRDILKAKVMDAQQLMQLKGQQEKIPEENLFVFGIRRRIEALREKLWPDGATLGFWSIFGTETEWRKILTSQDKPFITSVKDLCKLLDDDKVRRMGFDTKMPKTREEIKLAFESVGHIPDDDEVNLVECLLTPLPSQSLSLRSLERREWVKKTFG